jgi:hypothetical protein
MLLYQYEQRKIQRYFVVNCGRCAPRSDFGGLVGY